MTDCVLPQRMPSSRLTGSHRYLLQRPLVAAIDLSIQEGLASDVHWKLAPTALPDVVWVDGRPRGDPRHARSFLGHLPASPVITRLPVVVCSRLYVFDFVCRASRSRQAGTGTHVAPTRSIARYSDLEHVVPGRCTSAKPTKV
jgi:hypothetical protein